ncbi:uncharacterized protein LOC112347613 [Selaginella moellendorffii]|uniref:uncharacterized protein LOC112347613 n=1 Tax=Selaginella moellendorffii TaxID=88036 RepID=UPI000D1C504E|nr:uncharacterized protein LOC112347613 [Selaginella moellendorffii]|eukprot:XP_024534493.1 uncharacterized protein LOC112347613 [Selaginella moellendorffii]
MEEIEHVVQVFRGMHFNERALERKYAMAFTGPIDQLFDDESVRIAAARALENNGGDLSAIGDNGYRAVIHELFLLQKCVEKDPMRVGVPRVELPSPLAKKAKANAWSSSRPKPGQLLLEAATEKLAATEDSRICSNVCDENFASTSGRDEELPEFPPGFEDFGKVMLLPVRQAYDWGIVVQGCELSELKGLLHSRLEIVPAPADELAIVSCEDSGGVFKFVSGVVAEMFYEACVTSPPVVQGRELSVQRLYAPAEIPSVDFAWRSSSTLVYFRGDGARSSLKQHFEKVLPEKNVGEVVRSMHIFPEGFDALVELESDLVADLFFYRCGKNRCLEWDFLVCRSKVMPPDDEVEPFIDVVSIPDLNWPIKSINQAADSNKVPQPASKRLEIRLLPDSVQAVKAKDTQAAGETQLPVSDYDTRALRGDGNLKTGTTKAPRPTKGKEIPFQLRLMPASKKLVVLEDDRACLATFFETLLLRRKPDECCQVCSPRPNMSIVKCSSEAAADAIMDAYVEEPQKFIVDGQPLQVLRDRSYHRPGAVNKMYTVEDEDPGEVSVSGLPDLPPQLLKAALRELLDRTFASDSSVKEHGNGLFKEYHQKHGLRASRPQESTGARLEPQT